MYYDCAPLQGVTTYVFRNTHREFFPGVSRYFIPFFSPPKEHLITPREMRDLLPAHNAGTPVVPQLMVRSPEDCLWAIGAMAELGYGEVNLNLGCPSGTVVAKGKGSGLLARPDELDRFLDTVYARSVLPVSIKTRLGIQDPAEFRPILEIYNRYPLTELIIHPRVQKEFYKGSVHLDAFAAALERCRCPVRYNGDLLTVADCQALEARFPQVERIMLGRGLAADPALVQKLLGGAAVDRVTLERFLDTLFARYLDCYGNVENALQRMKELWYYLIRLFDGGERLGMKLRRARGQAAYQDLTRRVLQELPLRQEAAGPFE